MPRWLRYWSIATVIATGVLLALGTFVTSFRVGMADPVWPTEPWRLALIDWTEPSRGFLIEHSHRLAGFTIGAMMSVLTLGLWWTERRPTIRWGGLASIAALLGTYGYLHGILIRQTKTLEPGSPLTVPPAVLGALILVLGLVAAATVATVVVRSPGWAARVFASLLLVGVMVQGLLGGLRVHLNALYGTSLAVIHAAFSQIVFGLAIVVMVLLNRKVPSLQSEGIIRARAWSVAALTAVYGQICFGALLRHAATPLGARLHLLFAFVAAVAIIVAATRLWRHHRWISTLAIFLVCAQIALGVEAWIARYLEGLQASQLLPVTEFDAILRSTHALVGYLLFASAIGMVQLAFSPSSGDRSEAPADVLEGVA